jgi:hypothetical protein
MNQPRKSGGGAVAGSFVVDFEGGRQVGLTAHDVAALVEGADGENAKIYRIHRLDEAGRMELVGISRGMFLAQDCLIFSRRQHADARADFEALRAAAAESLPPCRIELQLAEAPSLVLPHVVVLVFCAACVEGVGHWLGGLGLQPGDRADGGPAAWQAYLEAGPRVIERETLKEAR